MSVEQPAGKLDSALSRILWWIVAGSLLVTSLLFTVGGADWWRWPKELALRAAAIVLTALLLTMTLAGRRIDWKALINRHRRLFLLLAGIGAWSVIGFVFSTNRAVGVPALAYTASVMVVFLATFVAVEDRTLTEVMAVPIVAGLLNALLTISQSLDLWNPFRLDLRIAAHYRTTGLQGNTNDVGDYLLIVVLATAAYAFVRKRFFVWVAIAILATGVLATQSLAANVALGAGVLAIMVTHARRRSTAALVVILLAALVAMSYLGPVRERLKRAQIAAAQGDVSELLSARIFGWGTAWDMFRDRPLLGMGPGTYKFHYMPYRTAFSERHPRWIGVHPENFAEAHSDHLQILAEEGLPGYALYLAALLLIASAAWHAPPDDERGQFVRVLAVPLMVALAVLTLAAFPLELAGTTHMLVYFAAVITRWGAK